MNMGAVVAVCAVIGAVTVVVTIAAGHGNLEPHGSAFRVPANVNEDYGDRLIAHTTEYLGRFINSQLACAACHLKAGQEPGSLSLTEAIGHYPRNSPRTGGRETIEDRINVCVMRNENGRALPVDSPEMKAMVAWLRFIAAEYDATGASEREPHAPPAFKTPNRAANLDAGKDVFDRRCASCHGENGAGLPASTKPLDGYVFPPLWGANSFNDGAGMHRVLTAAAFIKAKMPAGKADLTDDEAFDVAAYINAKPRPEMANLDRDYPDRTLKPIDTPYGPYADPFPIAQHRFGPFPPIDAWYRDRQSTVR